MLWDPNHGQPCISTVPSHSGEKKSCWPSPSSHSDLSFVPSDIWQNQEETGRYWTCQSPSKGVSGHSGALVSHPVVIPPPPHPRSRFVVEPCRFPTSHIWGWWAGEETEAPGSCEFLLPLLLLGYCTFLPLQYFLVISWGQGLLESERLP